MRLGDLDALIWRAVERYKEMMGTDIGHGMSVIASMITDAPTIDAVPVDTVAQMFYDFTGDLCPCNYSDTDEWLPEACELLNECPNPKGDELACWKQYIKHWRPRKDGEGNG